jgi:pyruvate formate lyase activating enzyme
MNPLAIKGFVETSLCDWDGRVAAVLFLPGCNLRCPFCQNGDLISGYDALPSVNFEIVAAYLTQHSEWIDGVVVTGGEPTIWKDLADLLSRIKDLGFAVKLDTNGTNPDVIEDLCGRRLADFVAMDVKAPLDQRYSLAAGTEVDLAALRRSIELVGDLGDAGEFRTTLVPGLVGEEEVELIARAIKGARRYVLQRFVPENSLDSKLRRVVPFDDSFVSRMVRKAGQHVDSCFYRGKLGVGLS